jgi:hypothetical protein
VLDDFSRYILAWKLCTTMAAAPICAESCPMPTDDGLWLEDFQGIEHVRREPIEPGEHPPIEIAESHLVRRFTPQNIELVPKHQDLARWQPRQVAVADMQSL